MGTRSGELVERFGGRLEGDADIEVSAITPLDRAGASDISFLSNSKLRALAAHSHAAALILAPADEAEVAASFAGARIVTANPYAWFARAAQYFDSRRSPSPEPGIHPTAAVHANAQVDPTAHIGPHVTVKAGAAIKAGGGRRCRLLHRARRGHR